MQTPIGIFDSGVGGTSIWKEIHRLLPQESTLYLADSKNAPYGTKSPEQIVALSIKNTEWLLQRHCKIIVVACNTATTNAIAHLRANYNIPFIGIEPAIKPAALNSNNKRVGVLATKGTLASSLFQNTSKLYASGITVIEKEGDGLVELIEAGKGHAEETKNLLRGYLQPMLDQGIDTLVLGCTHYPYLMPLLKELLPTSVHVIDSGFAVAMQTQSVLAQHQLLSTVAHPFHRFFTNSRADLLERFVQGKGVSVGYLDF